MGERPTGWRWFFHVMTSGGLCLVHCPHYPPRSARGDD